jgi:hypothetical protein
MEEEALRCARLAVQRDFEGRLPEAVELYSECLALLGNSPRHADVVKEYTTRCRLLKLRIFEQQKNRAPDLAERLKELRGGKDSPVSRTSAPLIVSSDSEDEDTKAQKLLEQVKGEVDLEGGGSCEQEEREEQKESSSCSDKDEDDELAIAVKAKERALKEKAKKRLGR